MNTGDLHLLTGAYVLNALTAEEHDHFERHLPGCASCDQEVRELAATAGRLAAAVSVPLPAALKHRVMSRISTERQEPPHVARQSRRGAARRGSAVSRFVLAACVAAAAAFGGTAVWQHQVANDAQDKARRAERQAAELASVLAAPDAEVASASLARGARGTVVVSRGLDKAAFLASGLPKPPEGKVYQLWFADRGAMRPAGLMDPAAATGALLMEGPLDGASGMGITVEPAGGSERPTSAPLATMELPS